MADVNCQSNSPPFIITGLFSILYVIGVWEKLSQVKFYVKFGEENQNSNFHVSVCKYLEWNQQEPAGTSIKLDDLRF